MAILITPSRIREIALWVYGSNGSIVRWTWARTPFIIWPPESLLQQGHEWHFGFLDVSVFSHPVFYSPWKIGYLSPVYNYLSKWIIFIYLFIFCYCFLIWGRSGNHHCEQLLCCCRFFFSPWRSCLPFSQWALDLRTPLVCTSGKSWLSPGAADLSLLITLSQNFSDYVF